MRHGFESEYNSEEYLAVLDQVFYMYYTDKRHETAGNPRQNYVSTSIVGEWRMKERLKTVAAALVVCLNVGTDPPDVIKPTPCAKLECWVDISLHPPAKALETVGKNLQQQYESLSFRTRYKQYLDPHFEATKKFCVSLRRNAKDERILFHYNGHGVPRPTSSGEIWVFNNTFTQYIPIPLYDLHSWLGGPGLFVWECNNAGEVLINLNKTLERKHNEQKRESEPTFDCIQLAACSSNELLPLAPEVPADMFTSCLTTPIEMSISYFLIQNPLFGPSEGELPPRIPGRLQERRTPIGELNWIFTAVTDTIAWNSLPRSQFRQLFRQDLMVAALFRNFLLAQRVLVYHGCKPITSPPLPTLHNHRLWRSWDFALEHILLQIPRIGSIGTEFKSSSFFSEQLTAFEVYLAQVGGQEQPPTELPVLLQVLLSQAHRLRALVLLSRFLDLGPWAVSLALEIGIFPYVLKLLQSGATELRPVMVFIWSRILAVDGSCQVDLLKDNGYLYFVNIFNSPITNSCTSERKAMCAFILALFSRNFPVGQTLCATNGVLESCLQHGTSDENPLLRQWCCLCFSLVIRGNNEAKRQAQSRNAHTRLELLLADPVPEVRAAALNAFSSFLTPSILGESQLDMHITSRVLLAIDDASLVVRRELASFLILFVRKSRKRMVLVVAAELLHYSKTKKTQPPTDDFVEQFGTQVNNCYTHRLVWLCCVILSSDPISSIANLITDIVGDLLTGAVAVIRKLCTDKVQETLFLRCKEFIGRWLRSKSSFDLHAKRASPTQLYLTYGVRTASMMQSLKAFSKTYNPTRNPLASFKPEGRCLTDQSRYILQLCQDIFLEFSTEYFREPQMRPPEADEPGSEDYNQRLWRRIRNEKVILSTQPQKELAVHGKWVPSCSLIQPSKIRNLLFHQFEDHLLGVHDSAKISIWNWKEKRPICVHENLSTVSRIDDIKLINEDDVALLFTAASDGILRLYRNYDTFDRLELVSAWKALYPTISHLGQGPICLEWQQGRGSLIVAGNANTVRLWDALREACFYEVQTRSNTAVTCLTSEQVAGNIFIAGMENGLIRVFDRRERSACGLINTWKGHSSRIINVHMQRGGDRELLSASCSQINLWDLRFPTPVQTFDFKGRKEIQSFTVHEHAPIFSVGYVGGNTCIYSMQNLQSRSSESLHNPLYTFVAPNKLGISALSFHPHEMILAASGEAENETSLFRCKS